MAAGYHTTAAQLSHTHTYGTICSDAWIIGIGCIVVHAGRRVSLLWIAYIGDGHPPRARELQRGDSGGIVLTAPGD